MNLPSFRMETNIKFQLILVIKQSKRWQSDSKLVKPDKEVDYISDRKGIWTTGLERNVCMFVNIDWYIEELAANTVSGHSLPYNLSLLMNTNINNELKKKKLCYNFRYCFGIRLEGSSWVRCFLIFLICAFCYVLKMHDCRLPPWYEIFAFVGCCAS